MEPGLVGLVCLTFLVGCLCGAFLMKVLGVPDPEELAKLDHASRILEKEIELQQGDADARKSSDR